MEYKDLNDDKLFTLYRDLDKDLFFVIPSDQEEIFLETMGNLDVEVQRLIEDTDLKFLEIVGPILI